MILIPTKCSLLFRLLGIIDFRKRAGLAFHSKAAEQALINSCIRFMLSGYTVQRLHTQELCNFNNWVCMQPLLSRKECYLILFP